MVLRGALPCHDAAVPGSAIDRLIAASLCLTGDATRAPGGGPLAPPGDSASAQPACLHCSSGQAGALVVISLAMLTFAGWRPLRLPARTSPGRGFGHWPAAAARGPPRCGPQVLLGTTLS